MIYFNARSLLPKIDELRLICTVKKPDIVCIVESWLSCDISDAELYITDYFIARLDRNRHGGGILFFVRSCYHFNIILHNPLDLEFLFLSVYNLKSSCKTYVALFYQPPNSVCCV